MDSIRVPKVEHVSCTRSGTTLVGTVHLTAHHLIFRSDDSNEEEMWVPYPLISLVTRSPQTLRGECPLTFHSRTFETFSLSFCRESEAIDVFDTVKDLTVAPSVYHLYAFFYRQSPPFITSDGWSIYSPREEFGRMGLGSRTKAWRFTDVNKDYSFCPTYPARLVVPTRISDTTLQYAAKYRSKCRIPVLTYLHWANFGSITRSSQPMVGITQNRSIQDEKLIEAVFQSHHTPEMRASSGPVYGATSTNLIIDARPTTNAMANAAKGAGTENMDHYREGKKVYLGIDHIHVMRESLAKVIDTLREADAMLASINNDLPDQVSNISLLDRQGLRRSGWLRHISAILEGTSLIARNVHVNSSHVLIHCSDGWDRTSQLSALAQLCLDPFYRTIRGFEILIEKDWVSFGHKFMDRCGHLSSDKFFISPTEITGNAGGAEAAQALLASVQNRFTSQQHVKETSPIFHQFLEAVRQIQRQFPERFEFNERFLRKLYYHLYSCQFGTFLFNTERERRIGQRGPPPCERTVSVWDFFNSPEEMQLNLNPMYEPSLDDPSSRISKADMGVLFPNPKNVRFWHELYGRTDEEMNGRQFTPQTPDVDVVGPVEASEDGPVVRTSTPSITPLPPSPSRSPNLTIMASQSTPSVSSSHPSNATLSPFSDRYNEANPASLSANPDLYKSSDAITSAPPTRSQSPNRIRINKPPDFFASSGVKSMWGKLSSNASAAFSVVQDAYTGVTKDLRFPGGFEGSSASTSKSSELRSRDTLSRWGDDPDRPPTSYFHNNPWAATSSRHAETPSLFDNPWGSVRSTSPSRQTLPRVDLDVSSSPFRTDPTIVHPKPISAGVYTISQPAAGRSTVESTALQPDDSVPPTQKEDTDPLGVGFI